MEGDHRDVLSVPLQRLHTALVLVVPDLHQPSGESNTLRSELHLASLATSLAPVIRPRDEVRLVAALEVVDTVDSLVMALQGEVGVRGAELPHLRGEGGARKKEEVKERFLGQQLK